MWRDSRYPLKKVVISTNQRSSSCASYFFSSASRPRQSNIFTDDGELITIRVSRVYLSLLWRGSGKKNASILLSLFLSLPPLHEHFTWRVFFAPLTLVAYKSFGDSNDQLLTFKSSLRGCEVVNRRDDVSVTSYTWPGEKHATPIIVNVRLTAGNIFSPCQWHFKRVKPSFT